MGRYPNDNDHLPERYMLVRPYLKQGHLVSPGGEVLLPDPTVTWVRIQLTIGEFHTFLDNRAATMILVPNRHGETSDPVELKDYLQHIMVGPGYRTTTEMLLGFDQDWQEVYWAIGALSVHTHDRSELAALAAVQTAVELPLPIAMDPPPLFEGEGPPQNEA